MKVQAKFEAGSPEFYGFGIGIMKNIKVCACCGASEPSDRYTCRKCGAQLPQQTLFQVYQQMHERCPVCDTVLKETMKFCPHCGVKLGEKESVEKVQVDSCSGVDVCNSCFNDGSS